MNERTAGVDLSLFHELQRGADPEALADIGYSHAETSEQADRHAEALRQLSRRALSVSRSPGEVVDDATVYCGDHGLPMQSCSCAAARHSVYQRVNRRSRIAS